MWTYATGVVERLSGPLAVVELVPGEGFGLPLGVGVRVVCPRAWPRDRVSIVWLSVDEMAVKLKVEDGVFRVWRCFEGVVPAAVPRNVLRGVRVVCVENARDFLFERTLCKHRLVVWPQKCFWLRQRGGTGCQSSLGGCSPGSWTDSTDDALASVSPAICIKNRATLALRCVFIWGRSWFLKCKEYRRQV